MTLEELLNSEMDLASIAALGRQGLAWWLDELAALLPTGWRDRLSSRPRVWIEPRVGGGWSYWRDGQAGEARAAAVTAGTRIGLLAPAGTILAREIPTPRMPVADVRRMVGLDIDRLSPLAPDLIHFDLEVVDREGEDGKQKVVLGILPRDEATRLLTLARKDGFTPSALAARLDGARDARRFDFLPQVLAEAGEGGRDRVRDYAWVAAGVLIVVNLAVLVGRDIIDVSRLQQAVDGQRPVVDAVLRLRRRVEAEDSRRRDLLNRGHRGDPLRMLNALTQAIPQGAWVQHLEWNGQTLRIVGFKREDIDMAAAVRGSGAFTNPRALAAEPTAGPTPMRPFDITADARPEPKP